MSAVERRVYRLCLCLEAPYASHGLAAAALGVDVSLPRDHRGGLILPGTLVKGALRHALTMLEDRSAAVPAGAAQAWLGTESADFMPDRGCVDIPDLTLRHVGALGARDESSVDWHADAPDRELRMAVTSRIRIDADSGAAEKGMLQVIEMPFPTGTPFCFETDVTAIGTAADLDRIAAGLKAALRAVPAVGAFKSAGFGFVLQENSSFIETSEERRELAVPAAGGPLPLLPRPATDGGDLVDAVLTLDRPFVVNAEQVADNVFKGSTVIPGAVLKGVLATRLHQMADAGDPSAEALLGILDVVTFGHAFPVPAGTAVAGTVTLPSPPPLSWAFFAKEKVPVDLIAEGEGATPVRVLSAPESDDMELPRVVSPRFQPDWKGADWGFALACCGWPEDFETGLYETRVRTRIDEETWAARYDTAVDAGQLFAHSMVRPVKTVDGAEIAYRWAARLYRPQGVDRVLFARMLGVLADGLDGIGKTDARAAVTIDYPALPETPDAGAGTRWLVRLRTPALLFSMDDMRQAGAGPDGLRRLYAGYFATASGNSLELVRFFAGQEMAGGYLVRRFRKGERYDPYALTSAGSVFLLEATAAAGAHLKDWRLAGLPLAAAYKGTTWETCPFLRENGYGAVDIEPFDAAAMKARYPEGLHVF